MADKAKLYRKYLWRALHAGPRTTEIYSIDNYVLRTNHDHQKNCLKIYVKDKGILTEGFSAVDLLELVQTSLF
jgi:hypothetical protein